MGIRNKIMNTNKTLFPILLVILCMFSPSCQPNHEGNKRKAPPAANGDPPGKPIYRVYMENSASMDGYVKGVTNFETTIYNYLIDIKNYNLANEIRLFYINSDTVYFGNNIHEYIGGLEPDEFRQRRGNRGSTDIANMFDTLLKLTDSRTVSIFISDCIFSPGSKQSAADFLEQQQAKIKDNFWKKLREMQMITAVYQLESKFAGRYFNYLDSPTPINQDRPYYIWLIGKKNHVLNLVNTVQKASIHNGVNNYYYLFPPIDHIDYMVVNNHRIGTFRRDKSNPKTSINSARIESKGKNAGKFGFAIGVDLNQYIELLGDDYLLKVSNYAYNRNYTLEVVRSQTPGYTHLLKLWTKKPLNEKVTIRLTRSIPDWVFKSTTFDDRIITHASQQDKTYGFQHIVAGVHDAYHKFSNNDSTIFSATVSVNK